MINLVSISMQSPVFGFSCDSDQFQYHQSINQRQNAYGYIRDSFENYFNVSYDNL